MKKILKIFSYNKIGQFLNVGSFQFLAQGINFVTLFWLAQILESEFFTNFFYLRLGLLISIEFLRFSFEKSMIKKNKISLNIPHLFSLILLSTIYFIYFDFYVLIYLLVSYTSSIYYLKEKVYYNYTKQLILYNKLDLAFHVIFPTVLIIFYFLNNNINLETILFIDGLRIVLCFFYSKFLGNNARVNFSRNLNEFTELLQYTLNYFRNNPLVVLNALSTNLDFKSIIILFSSLSDLYKNRIVPIFQILLFSKYKHGSQLKSILFIMIIGFVFQTFLVLIPENVMSLVINDFSKFKIYFIPILINSLSLTLINFIGVELRFLFKDKFEIIYSFIIVLTSVLLFYLYGFELTYIIHLSICNFLIPLITLYVIRKIKKKNFR